MPYTKNIIRRPIPENSGLLKTFCCECPCERIKSPLCTLCYGSVKSSIGQRVKTYRCPSFYIYLIYIYIQHILRIYLGAKLLYEPVCPPYICPTTTDFIMTISYFTVPETFKAFTPKLPLKNRSQVLLTINKFD